MKGRKRKTKSWFASECQAQRTIYHRKLRKAVRENNDEERKSASKNYNFFLKQRQLSASERFITELQNEELKEPKDYWNLLESFDQEQGKLPIAESVLFEHFKNLKSATSPHRNKHEKFLSETTDNLTFIENFSLEEAISCPRKIKNGKSAGHDDVFPEFLKYPHECD